MLKKIFTVFLLTVLFCLIFLQIYYGNTTIKSKNIDITAPLNVKDVEESFLIGEKLLKDLFYAKDCGGSYSLEDIKDNEPLFEYIDTSIKIIQYNKKAKNKLINYTSKFVPMEWSIKENLIRMGIAARVSFNYPDAGEKYMSGYGEPVYFIFKKDADGNMKIFDLYIESIDAAYRGVSDNYNEKLWVTPELYNAVLEKINKAFDNIK